MLGVDKPQAVWQRGKEPPQRQTPKRSRSTIAQREADMPDIISQKNKTVKLDVLSTPTGVRTPVDRESTNQKRTVVTNPSLYDEIVKPFADNAARDPQVIKIDQNCAAGGTNMNTTLKAIKQACLMYTQSPVPYKNESYHISELLNVKAQVVAQCQRMLRENLFETA